MEVSLQSFRKRFTYDPQKDLLGKGGFGDVYKAYDNEDQIFVALKIAHASADDKHNLINEIKRFKKLNHPNIIKHIEAYEVNTGGFDIHGRPIINHVGILEYADKGTLADLLKNPNDFGSYGNFRSLIEDLANDIIDGLAYLHSRNIIHRDLKPTNILLFSDGDKLRAKITDFGIAKQADATAASTQLVGTVEYMAPEYFTTGNITKASDIWSMGVMLLEALSGTHPFGKTTQGLSNEQIIRNILSKDITAEMQNVTAPFKKLITRFLLREATLRPQSAEELKGLMLSSEDAFAEKTQIISKKLKILETEKSKSKWRRLITSLFDFDVSNGKWRKVVAREIVLATFLLFLSILSFSGLINVLFEFFTGTNSDFSNDEAFEITAILLFYTFYPIRFLILIVLWAFKTLGVSFHKISDRTKRGLKYSMLILTLIALVAFILMVFKPYYTIENNENDNVEKGGVKFIGQVKPFIVDTANLPDKTKLKSESESAQKKSSSYNNESKIHTPKSIQSKEKVYFLYCFYQDYATAVVVNYCTNIVSINVKEPESLYYLGFFAEDYVEKSCNTNFRGLKCRVFENYQDATNSLRLDFSEAIKLDFCKIEEFRKEAIRKFN
jgi:serine/threonine protein kinase